VKLAESEGRVLKGLVGEARSMIAVSLTKGDLRVQMEEDSW
jgi:hypothetical protein